MFVNKINAELLKKLLMTFGPSGNEEKIRKVIKEEIQEFADEIKVDALGNLIAIKKGKGKRIMVASHMDEIGIMVTNVDDDGFLRFTNIGGVSPFMSLGQKVIFDDETIGVIGMEKLDDIKDLKLNKMFIDVGLPSKEKVIKKINVGDVASFYSPFIYQNECIISKTLDDRIGCFVAIEALKKLKDTPNEIYFVFTVQEEVGLRGAKTAAYGINPDLGIAIDVTLTGDTPKAEVMDVGLGKGAAIKVKDRSIIVSPKVKDLITEVAVDNEIPFQYEILDAGGTDSGAIHLSRSGIPSGVISIPCRYVHSPSEMVYISDVINSIKLLIKVLEKEKINI